MFVVLTKEAASPGRPEMTNTVDRIRTSGFAKSCVASLVALCESTVWQLSLDLAPR